MASEFRMDPDRVADEMPLAKLFAYQAWCMENDPWREVRRESDGYIAQEIENRLKAGHRT